MSRSADRTAPRRRGRDTSGFTLVEVLVAFAVMATILGVLYRGVVQSRAGAVGFAARMQEEVVARSLLDEFEARRDLRDGSYAGTRDGRRWVLRASAMDLSAQLPKGLADEATKPEDTKVPKPIWVAQRLALRVDTAGRPLEAETIHLVRQPPPDDGAAR